MITTLWKLYLIPRNSKLVNILWRAIQRELSLTVLRLSAQRFRCRMYRQVVYRTPSMLSLLMTYKNVSSTNQLLNQKSLGIQLPRNMDLIVSVSIENVTVRLNSSKIFPRHHQSRISCGSFPFVSFLYQ